MIDYALTVIAHLLIIGIIAGGFCISGASKPNWIMFGKFSFVYSLYCLITLLGSDFSSGFKPLANLQWNWGGKFLSLFLILYLWFLYRGSEEFSPLAVGFTLRQKNVFLALCVLFGIILIPIVFAEFRPERSDMETLFFQALIPGLTEEPMFRGVLLLLLCRAFTSRHFAILKADFNTGCWLALLLFGIGHGLVIQNMEIKFSVSIVISTFICGALLLWFRLITGSLLIPILLHNFINFSRVAFY